MGLGPVALKLYEEFLADALMREGQSICDLGSQDFCPGNYDGWLRKIPNPDMSARTLMRELRLSYTCVDINKEHGAVPLDLNFASPDDLPRRPFDIVTNHGTSEHVFNQANCFRLVHEWTRP